MVDDGDVEAEGELSRLLLVGQIHGAGARRRVAREAGSLDKTRVNGRAGRGRQQSVVCLQGGIGVDEEQLAGGGDFRTSAKTRPPGQRDPAIRGRAGRSVSQQLRVPVHGRRAICPQPEKSGGTAGIDRTAKEHLACLALFLLSAPAGTCT